MGRYAQELYSALANLPNRSRTIGIEQAIQQPWMSRLFRHRQIGRLDSAWFRYVTYPRSLRYRRAGVFHILDQGYAHLLRSLDPDRTVVTCHDLIPLLAAEGVIGLQVPPTVVRTFRWRIKHLERARAVIAVSHATRTTLERFTRVRPDRITVVHQGVSPVFKVNRDNIAATRASAGLADATSVLLQVASPVRYKNTPALLHALAILRSNLGSGAMLARIGAPMFPDEAELASRLGVEHAIRHVGTVDDPTLAKWYNAADALVFPSLWEGFGWPPLEAMACGTPVVASDTPAIAEVVQDAGLLASPEDPAALAQAIERVLTEDGLAASLRQKGLARASHFTWAKTAAATAAVYEDVLRLTH